MEEEVDINFQQLLVTSIISDHHLVTLVHAIAGLGINMISDSNLEEIYENETKPYIIKRYRKKEKKKGKSWEVSPDKILYTHQLLLLQD